MISWRDNDSQDPAEPHSAGYPAAAPSPLPPTPGTGRQPNFTGATMFDEMIASLDRLIDRHFAAHRTLVVERESAKHWTASIGDDVLYRSPNRAAVERFARTFAERTPGITLIGVNAEFSVRVPTLRAVEA